MMEELLQTLEDGTDILVLGQGLLRLCRAHLAELRDADGTRETWPDREALRSRCEELFIEVDDEELDEDERVELVAIALAWRNKLPPVLIARIVAEALDEILGRRLLPMFIGRTVTLAPGDAFPVPHRDWRRIAAARDGDAVRASDSSLDALPHLGLAGEWASEVTVTIDGDWRRWHLMPQLGAGDRLACATPNASLAELVLDRTEIAGRAAFCNARFGADPDAQIRDVITLLDTAHTQRCRAVVFPELTVSLAGRRAVASWLASQDVVDLVVAGSAHRPVDDAVPADTNSPAWLCDTVVYVRGAGAALAHRKIRPIVIPDPQPDPDGAATERVEAIAPGPFAVTAQLSPHWMTLVLLGEDALIPPMPRALRELGPTLVLVPALSFDMDVFRTLARDLVSHAHGVLVVGNACLAAAEHVIGLPDQPENVLSVPGPPHALVIVTLDSLTRRPSIVTADDRS